MVDITEDKGMTSALNKAYAEFEKDRDRTKAMTRATLLGRGLAIRSLRLREEQFKHNSQGGKGGARKKTPARKRRRG